MTDLINSYHKLDIRDKLPRPISPLGVCPFFDFTTFKSNWVRNSYVKQPEKSRPNLVLSFARATHMIRFDEINPLNFTIINVYLRDRGLILFQERTPEFISKLATYLASYLNKEFDHMLRQIAACYDKKSLMRDNGEVNIDQEDVETPLIFKGYKIIDVRNPDPGPSPEVPNEFYTINGQLCPEICFCERLKKFRTLFCSHSVYDLNYQKEKRIRSIEVINGAYSIMFPNPHASKTELEEDRAQFALILHQDMEPPSFLIDRLNMFYQSPRDILGYLPFPINQGWTLYFKRFYVVPKVDRKTVKTWIEWRSNCVQSVVNREIETNVYNQLNPGVIIAMATNDADYENDKLFLLWLQENEREGYNIFYKYLFT